MRKKTCEDQFKLVQAIYLYVEIIHTNMGAQEELSQHHCLNDDIKSIEAPNYLNRDKFCSFRDPWRAWELKMGYSNIFT